jgi:riboflavin synthase
MFTGIVEEIGSVEAMDRHKTGARLLVKCARVLSDLTLGASIAVNGVCLTAVDIRPDGFSADLAPETLNRSNLGDLGPGDLVNLERPLSLQTRLSGHIVQGHVDGTGLLEELRDLSGGNYELTVRVTPELDKFLVYKGSIAIDGVSLTVACVTDQQVRVAIIPHTWNATNLKRRRVGDRVNIECDLLAKHLEKLLASMELPRGAR